MIYTNCYVNFVNFVIFYNIINYLRGFINSSILISIVLSYVSVCFVEKFLLFMQLIFE